MELRKTFTSYEEGQKAQKGNYNSDLEQCFNKIY